MKQSLLFAVVGLMFTNTSFAQKKHVFSLNFLKQETPFLKESIIENTDVVSPLVSGVGSTPNYSIGYKYHFKNNIYLGVELGSGIGFLYNLVSAQTWGNVSQPDTIYMAGTGYSVPYYSYIYKFNTSVSYELHLHNRHVVTPSIAPGLMYIDEKTKVYGEVITDDVRKFNTVAPYDFYHFEDHGGVSKGGLFFITNFSLSYKFLMGGRRNFGVGLTANYQQGYTNIFERNVMAYKEDNPSIYTKYQLSAKGSSYSLGLDFIFQFGD